MAPNYKTETENTSIGHGLFREGSECLRVYTFQCKINLVMIGEGWRGVG